MLGGAVPRSRALRRVEPVLPVKAATSIAKISSGECSGACSSVALKIRAVEHISIRGVQSRSG